MKLVMSFFFSAFIAGAICAQNIPQAKKFTTLGKDTTTQEFLEKTDAFIATLSRDTESTKGFIAISAREYSTAMTLRRMTKARVERHRNLKGRVEISHPGGVYNNRWSESEFWLIPKGAERPYRLDIFDCICPTIAINEPDLLASRKQPLTYTATIDGGAQESITYHWKVVGGKIIGGQGSRSIQVRPDNRSVKSLTVTLKIDGFDEDCYCMDNASVTTQLQIK